MSTSEKDIDSCLQTLRQTFASARTKDIAWRKTQLVALKKMIDENESAIFEALQADFGKPKQESWMTETGFIRAEVVHTLQHIDRWTEKKVVSAPLVVQPARAEIHKEPKGVVLIIAPWNYPFMLTLSPLIAAIAAGNCAVLKPSELTPATSAIIAKLLGTYLDSEAVQVIEGGVEVSTLLLQQRFDHIFFTGSARVAKVVMQAAAEHLTPVTLELGGKSPCIVTTKADLKVAAKRIVWGKFLNAGQTCVAPDYLLVDASIEEALVAKLKARITDCYGADPQTSPHFARIVNTGHFDRLVQSLEGADILCGGEHQRDSRYLAPTLVRATPEAPLMQSEIFGPILPIISYQSLSEALEFIQAREKPLALYAFTASKKEAETVLSATSSGGACINDCVIQLSPPELPFGGIGPSGIGEYHGEFGFLAFSHQKSVIRKGTWVDPALRYPPYSDTKINMMRRLL